MELFLLFPHLRLEKVLTMSSFFYKSFNNEFKNFFWSKFFSTPQPFSTQRKIFDTKFYFSYILTSNLKTSFTKSFSILSTSLKLLSKIGNGIIQPGNGIISPISWPPIKKLFFTKFFWSKFKSFSKKEMEAGLISSVRHRCGPYPSTKLMVLNQSWVRALATSSIRITEWYQIIKE